MRLFHLQECSIHIYRTKIKVKKGQIQKMLSWCYSNASIHSGRSNLPHYSRKVVVEWENIKWDVRRPTVTWKFLEKSEWLFSPTKCQKCHNWSDFMSVSRILFSRCFEGNLCGTQSPEWKLSRGGSKKMFWILSIGSALSKHILDLDINYIDDRVTTR